VNVSLIHKNFKDIENLIYEKNYFRKEFIIVNITMKIIEKSMVGGKVGKKSPD